MNSLDTLAGLGWRSFYQSQVDAEAALRPARVLHVHRGRVELAGEEGREAVEISDYLDSYKLADGSFAPFFVQQGDARFTTMPEDGATVRLSLGDRLVLGNAIYLVQQA